MGIQGCIPRFIKGHGSLILTILSGAGLIGSVILTAKQAPKAERELQEELHWKINHRVDEMMDEAEAKGHGQEPEDWTDDEHAELYDRAERETQLTVMEKIKVAGPIYAPVILLGLATLGCMAGAHILDVKKQAAILSAYALLNQDFKAYRQEIRDEYGDEADQKAWIESQKRVKVLEEEVKRLENIKGVCNFGIATLPGVIFRSDMANVERAMLHFNRNVCLRGWGTLEELYSFLGLPDEVWEFVKKEDDKDYGWNQYEDEVKFDQGWVDYILDEVTTADGEKAYLIDFVVPPYQLNGEDDEVHFYPGHNRSEAKRMLAAGMKQIPMLIDSTTHYCGAPMVCGW